MPTFRYRALTQVGEIVSGSLDAPSVAEVDAAHRISRPDPDRSRRASERRARFERRRRFSLAVAAARRGCHDLHRRSRACCCAPARASTTRSNCWRPTPKSDACARRRPRSPRRCCRAKASARRSPAIRRSFRPIYVALVRVGEASGDAGHDSRGAGAERQRAEALRGGSPTRCAIPRFCCWRRAACCLFFLTFVLPQFANVFRDFNAKLDPVLVVFLGLSEFSALERAGPCRGAAACHHRGVAGLRCGNARCAAPFARAIGAAAGRAAQS